MANGQSLGRNGMRFSIDEHVTIGWIACIVEEEVK